MLPPCRSGGIVERGPVSGATPTSPQNGTTGRRMPGRNSARSPARGTGVIRRYGIGEVVGEQPEARDARRPAPVGRLELEEVDLERVAGLGAVDRDRAVDLVDAVEVEASEVLDRRSRRQLAAAGVEQVELDDGAAVDGLDRRDRRVPREVEAIARDVECRTGLHGTTSSSVDRNAPDQTPERPRRPDRE